MKPLSARARLQRRSGVENRFEVVRHAMRADVPGDEAPFDAQPLHELGVLRSRREARHVDAVGDDVDLASIDSSGGQLVPERMRHRDDRFGAAIEKHFQPLEETDRGSLAHRADRFDRLGPQITQFEDERHALQRGHGPGRAGSEELG